MLIYKTEMSRNIFDNIKITGSFKNSGSELTTNSSTAIALTAGSTLTALQIGTYDHFAITNTSGVNTLTLDTAANLVSQYNGKLAINDCLKRTLSVTITANSLTFAIGTGGTLNANNNVVISATTGLVTLLIKFTNVTSGSEAYTLYIV